MHSQVEQQGTTDSRQWTAPSTWGASEGAPDPDCALSEARAGAAGQYLMGEGGGGGGGGDGKVSGEGGGGGGGGAGGPDRV